MSWVYPLFLAISLLTWPSKANMADGCVYLDNFDITTALNEELGLIIQNYGNISQCLCISGIHDFIGTNAPANFAAQETNWNRVASTIAQIISSASGYGRCNYPGSSQPACTQNDPCGYTCTDGFQLSGDNCVSLPPDYACNGQCSPLLYSFAVVGAKSMDQQTVLPQTVIEPESELGCPSGQTACSGLTSPECIDTHTNKFSCGGCKYPLEGQPANGRDCSQIFAVSSVQCNAGRCFVTGCEPGWMITDDWESCEPYKY